MRSLDAMFDKKNAKNVENSNMILTRAYVYDDFYDDSWEA